MVFLVDLIENLIRRGSASAVVLWNVCFVEDASE